MPVFEYTFTVQAPLAAVRAFHHDTQALKRLTPPPLFVQMHKIEPLAEGSVSEFTMWFGPLPVRWRAVHLDVSENGFTDRQERGLLKKWEHTHRFFAEGGNTTRVDEHIDYEHHRGLQGALSRLLFPVAALRVLFAYRERVTRRALESAS